ncbi:hypothetical protein GGX14DRAFT_154617 [Mycena pura]|uniref:Uncharacterized protein n=1 Tax=Mycena pura TaxID=153505 RepID=A0AAD6V721_9AGAR|nr:hypothetical protein GGX14DRAFT_154617 [Mycena pura]
MADTEYRTSAREQTLGKPLDTASRRRSRASHESAAVSTRSWVLTNAQSPPPPPPAEPIPVPEPVPTLSPFPRPLPEPPRRTSTVDEAGAEHMTVDVPPAEAGYQWTTGHVNKAREAHAHREGKGFVGGFVNSLRRLPRALVRTRRRRRGTMGTEGTEETEGTGMTGNTLPKYASTPPTPVVGDASVGFVRGGLAARGVQGLHGAGRNAAAAQPIHPSFILVPPEDGVQQGLTPHSEHGEGEAMPSGLEVPMVMESQYGRPVSSIHGTPASAPSARLSHADDRAAARAVDDGDEPVSVHPHPLPTEDYRRMSAHDLHSRTTIDSGSFSTGSPSFSSELHNPLYRFFNALHLLPWVATERVTADYHPKHKPKTGVSWYYPEGGLPATAPGSDHPTPDLDPSNTQSASRRNPSRRNRTRTRAAPAPEAPAVYNYPVAYYPAFSPPLVQSSRRPTSSRPHGGSRGSRARGTHVPRHHRRFATYHGPAPWLPPHPSPVYVIQATPSPGATPILSSNASPAPQSDAAGTAGSDPPGKSPGPIAAQMLAPVYMQMQMSPGSDRVAFVPGSPGYAYAYSSSIPMPAPAPSV